ncbi:MAG: orotidine-5'-phosphate decarboxylase [Candidatus Omnitrophota bacterium]
MINKKAQLIVALDVGSLEEAKGLIDTLSSVVDIFKVGSQLFTACGPTAVRFVQTRGKKVFLDLKYHDIPNTVANAVKEAVGLNIENNSASSSGIEMMTLHTVGGQEMLIGAKEAVAKEAQDLNVQRPLLIGITVLTSQKKDDSIQSLVLERAKLAKDAGLDGVVASVQEAPLIRRTCGQDFIIVTPGIRPAGSSKDDQERVATPRKAIENGSNFLVVGRPITQSKTPLESAKQILEEMEKAYLTKKD